MQYVASQEIGDPIPNNTPHAVSVTLPTWEATVGYEEGQDWVVKKMHSGYPRFFIHSKIKELCTMLEDTYGLEGTKAFIFPSYNVAKRCRDFIKEKNPGVGSLRILQLNTPRPKNKEEESYRKNAKITAIFVPEADFGLAKAYWQHSGEGISSRMAEYVLQEFKISSSNSNSSTGDQAEDYQRYIEERFGRNLDLSFGDEAKLILKRRIAGKLCDSKHTRSIGVDDVYLYPTGMAAIFNAHQAVLHTIPNEKSVCFGFPYVDTLNILKKFGPGVHFYGFGDEESMDELEKKLESGEKIMGFYCECPSNPLLKTPNLKRVAELSKKYDFPVIVDDTVGNFLNIDVLPFTDIVVSSLTKVFSGDSNVMAGSLILNPQSRYYALFKKYFDENFEDIFWVEDAIYLERNSRDFEQRSHRVNISSEAVVKLLLNSPLISKIYYPRISDTKKYYDEIKLETGGYGGLISLVFHDPRAARVFFNNVKLSKGPSLGTNFTIACPYAVLAHYQELDEVEQWGVDRNLVRISVGLEDQEELLNELQQSLDLAAQAIA